MRFSDPRVRARDLRGRIRDRETFIAAAVVASAEGHTRVRVGVAAVVVLVASCATGLVILVGFILLPPP